MNPKLKDGLILAAVLLVAFFAFEWHRAEDAVHDAQVKSDAYTAGVKDQQKVIDQKDADQAKVNADLKQQLAAIAAQRQQVPTPQQVVVDVSKLVPNLPKPLEVEQKPATATEPAKQNVVIPQEDIAALNNFKLDCEEKGAKLDACTLNLSAEQAKFDAQAVQLKDMTADRDNWKKAAKGGGFWRRTWTATKWAAIGAGIGYAAAHATH